MKKLKIIVIFILVAVMSSFSSFAFANSGPVYWQGYPSSGIMSIDKNSQIIVEKEDLYFDFSNYDNSDFSINGKVTAVYEMFNPTDDKKSVQMAFPFVGRLDNLSSDDIIIKSDESELPYEVYIGQDNKEESFEFNRIVNTITDKTYKAKNFKDNEIGKLYVIDVKPTTDQGIELAVDYKFNSEKTKVLSNGFSGYRGDDNETHINTWCDEPKTLEIFVLGEDIDIEISAYTDGQLENKTDLYDYKISTEEVEFKQYIMEHIIKKLSRINTDIVSESRVYNLYAKSIDECLTYNYGLVSEHDYLGQDNHERILVFVYTVDFPSNGRKNVSVSYKTSGSMDMTETSKPLYKFDYILNPAENWSDFKNLNIRILAPDEAPYIVRSNIELVSEEDKVYTASLETLPENDFSFTLYEDEKITLLDKVEGKLFSRFRYLTPIVKGAAVIIIVAIILMIVRNKKRK